MLEIGGNVKYKIGNEAIIDLYIYSIKFTYHEIVVNYKWFKSHYSQICKFYKTNKLTGLTKSESKSFYTLIMHKFRDFDSDLNYIFSLIEKPLLNLDFMDITQKYFNSYNLSLQAVLKLYKMINTIIKKEHLKNG